MRMIVTNCMRRSIILVKPGVGAKALVDMRGSNAVSVTLNRGQSKEIPFWDEIKDTPTVKKYIEHDLLIPAKEDVNEALLKDFTTAGTTLTLPPNLDPELDKDNAKQANMQIDIPERATATVKRGPGRPKKNQDPITNNPQDIGIIPDA